MRQTIFTIAPEVTAESFIAGLVLGQVKVYTERENGTLRKVHYLTEGSKAREIAEWVLAARNGELGEDGSDPMTMKAIAREMHTSVPSVRRLINDLLLTHELEDMDQADIDDLFTGAEELASDDVDPIDKLADEVLAGEVTAEAAIISILS